MRRSTLGKLLASQRIGVVLVRALDIATGEEQVIDPATDKSPLGLAASTVADDDQSVHVTLSGKTYLLTAYNVAQEIAIVGAVHIAQALAAIAVPSGYKVRVIDPRTAYATAERFPGVTLQQLWPEEAFAKTPLTKRTSVVVLAHDPKIDDQALEIALRSPAPYVGALGSVRTHQRRLLRLQERGYSASELAMIHAPVGLAIGALSPPEIAISILAELVKYRRNRARPKRVAGVVMAAGTSSRMGSNKLTIPVNGKPLVRHAVDAALEGGLDPVIVVIGHEANLVRHAVGDAPVLFVRNDQYYDGLGTSLRAGISELPSDCRGAMILLGDMPSVDHVLVARVLKAFDSVADCTICVATAKGQRGHPVLWDSNHFAEILHLEGDAGARIIMAKHADEIFEIDAGTSAPVDDIDTPEALRGYADFP